MSDNVGKPKIEIRSTKINFSSTLDQDYIPEEYKEQIENANVLIIPLKDSFCSEAALYPEGTAEFFKYLQSQKEISVEICSDDENYKELALHHDTVKLGEILVYSFVFPILVRIIWYYIEKTILEKKNEPEIKIKFNVQNDKGSKSIEYEGKASLFKPTFDEVVKGFENDNT